MAQQTGRAPTGRGGFSDPVPLDPGVPDDVRLCIDRLLDKGLELIEAIDADFSPGRDSLDLSDKLFIVQAIRVQSQYVRDEHQ
jgi:hypothetical protein